VPLRGGFADPLDPHRDTRADDGGLAWAMKQNEQAQQDRRDRGGAAREVTVRLVREPKAKDKDRDDGPARGFTLE